MIVLGLNTEGDNLYSRGDHLPDDMRWVKFKLC